MNWLGQFIRKTVLCPRLYSTTFMKSVALKYVCASLQTLCSVPWPKSVRQHYFNVFITVVLPCFGFREYRLLLLFFFTIFLAIFALFHINCRISLSISIRHFTEFWLVVYWMYGVGGPNISMLLINPVHSHGVFLHF